MISTERAKEIINSTEKPLKYTCGFRFRNPTILYQPVSKEKALKIVEQASFLDVDEYEDYIHINEYSCNDMW